MGAMTEDSYKQPTYVYSTGGKLKIIFIFEGKWYTSKSITDVQSNRWQNSKVTCYFYQQLREREGFRVKEGGGN